MVNVFAQQTLTRGAAYIKGTPYTPFFKRIFRPTSLPLTEGNGALPAEAGKYVAAFPPDGGRGGRGGDDGSVPPLQRLEKRSLKRKIVCRELDH